LTIIFSQVDSFLVATITHCTKNDMSCVNFIALSHYCARKVFLMYRRSQTTCEVSN